MGRENELPFDQHFLTSLIAPRGLFIRAAEADLWANPPGTKELADVARSVWKLLGRPNALVYSLRPGPHEYYLDDVRAFLDYCEALWKADSAVSTSTPKRFTDDYDQALAQAKAEQKLIVADFSGSDWCFWCQRLDEEVFAQESFIAEATNRYVLLMVDRPRDKSRFNRQP